MSGLSSPSTAVWAIDWENGNTAAKANHGPEVPVSWYLDDFPTLGCITAVQTGMLDSTTS